MLLKIGANIITGAGRIFILLGFIVTAILTWIVDDYFWHLPRYRTILLFLAAIHVVLGLWLLNTIRFAWHSVVLIVTGIIIGQWWLVKFGFTILTWSIGGFAP